MTLLATLDEEQLMLVLVCGGFGAALLALVVSSLREAAAMKRWPVAKGQVLSSKVEEYTTRAGAGNFGSRPRAPDALSSGGGL